MMLGRGRHVRYRDDPTTRWQRIGDRFWSTFGPEFWKGVRVVSDVAFKLLVIVALVLYFGEREARITTTNHAFCTVIAPFPPTTVFVKDFRRDFNCPPYNPAIARKLLGPAHSASSATPPPSPTRSAHHPARRKRHHPSASPSATVEPTHAASTLSPSRSVVTVPGPTTTLPGRTRTKTVTRTPSPSHRPHPKPMPSPTRSCLLIVLGHCI